MKLAIYEMFIISYPKKHTIYFKDKAYVESEFSN